MSTKGTFKDNKNVPIHGWYPYVEGFARNFILEIIEEFTKKGENIHDPFAGTGTTVLTANELERNVTYSEINPFMRQVIRAKSIAPSLNSNIEELSQYIEDVLEEAKKTPNLEEARTIESKAFRGTEYYQDKALKEILGLKNAIHKISTREEFKDIAACALGSIAVQSSTWVRASDLRKRVPQKYNPENFSPYDEFEMKINQFLKDIQESKEQKVKVNLLSDSAFDKTEKRDIDLVLTSPPYVNGTNYFRNTKLELWLTGAINSSNDLSDLRTSAMTAGINTVSSRDREINNFSFVNNYAKKIENAGMSRENYDKRIPKLVRGYFTDSKIWLENMYNMLKSGGHAVIDIGDSKFYGIHIPVDELLIDIGISVGFKLIESRFVRKRNSNDGSPLKQVLLIFKKI